ncbi:OmpH family outer membrane protein [Chitinophaga rhizosphaerae]|uniref:OmpH family outer membrane protein n=1 Tax=Chitinophaga rhizosphaerae TaxID=1864947 RepID=UPI000F806416|nr:OmpH family outer membrane protein [Chitinophaga rhizosphaerae]
MHTRQLIVKNGLFLMAIAGVFAACQQNNGKSAPKAGADSSVLAAGGAQRLAYVDIDSLEAHYVYFKDKKAELDRKKEAAQNDIAGRERALQNELQVLQQRAPSMTQAEGQAAEASLQRKAQQHEQNRQSLIAQLQTQEAQFSEDLQKRLEETIKAVNGNRYAFIFSYRAGASNILYKDEAYDITAEVIKALNDATPSK